MKGGCELITPSCLPQKILAQTWVVVGLKNIFYFLMLPILFELIEDVSNYDVLFLPGLLFIYPNNLLTA